MLTALLLLGAAATPQDPPAPPPPRDLRALLEADGRFAAVLAESDRHRLQIALAEVVERPDGTLGLRRSTLGNLDEYFYPASTVKLAGAVAALLDLNRVNAERGTAFGLGSRLEIGTLFPGDAVRGRDPDDVEGGWLTVAGAIRELLLVSDNQAFNDLYELVGHRELNEAVHAAGFKSLRVLHRLSEFHSPADQRRTRPVKVVDGDDVLERPARSSDLLLDNADLPRITAGTAYLRGGERVDEPFSFRFKNAVSLLELQDMLVEVVRPDIDTGKRGFPGLSIPQRRFLVRTLGMLPRESTNPRYDPERVPDHRVKFVLPGVRRVVPPEHVRVYDKIGRAYGFSTENAYVEDTRTGEGFFLAATLYTNPDGVLNDDRYAYEVLADPFLADLGEAVASALWGERRSRDVSTEDRALPAEARALLHDAEAMEILALHPYPFATPPGVDGREFHGYRVLGATRLRDAAKRRTLIAHVLEGIELWDRRLAACFNPRHGLRASGAGRTVDLVICFECLSIRVHGPGSGAAWVGTSDRLEPAVSALYRDAGLAIHGDAR